MLSRQEPLHRGASSHSAVGDDLGRSVMVLSLRLVEREGGMKGLGLEATEMVIFMCSYC